MNESAGMHNKDHDQIIELIPEFALGILDAGEADMVMRHIDTCTACQRELASYESVVDALSYAAPTMDPAVNSRSHLLEKVQASPAPKTTAAPSTWWQTVIGDIQEFLAGRRWQAALAIAVIAVLVGAVYFWQQNKSALLEQYELTSTDAAPEAQGLIEVAANGRDATLTVSGLPTLSMEEQYQLWLIADGQRYSGAVFSVEDDGTATVAVDSEQLLSEFGAFGITIEPAGGSPGPTGERVLGYNL
jgi:anti-sigma-K factor RskA